MDRIEQFQQIAADNSEWDTLEDLYERYRDVLDDVSTGLFDGGMLPGITRTEFDALVQTFGKIVNALDEWL